MAKQAEILRRIVALKRQGAEQHLRSVQIEAGAIESRIAELQARLVALDAAGTAFDAFRLAEEHGHARKLIAGVQAAEAELALKQKELAEAREALKQVFFSGEQLAASKLA